MNIKSKIIAALILCSAINLQAVEPELMALSALKQTVQSLAHEGKEFLVQDELYIPLIGITAVVLVAHIGVKLFRKFSANGEVPALKETKPFPVPKMKFKRNATTTPFKVPTLNKKQKTAPVVAEKPKPAKQKQPAAEPAPAKVAKVEPEVTINDRLYEYLTTTC